jgi:hypothetical protein
MVAEVFAGLGALKTAFDIAKGLKDIDDTTRRNTAVIDLQEKILSAQQSQASLVESISNLEKEVACLKAWEEEKSRYQLMELAPGIVALSIKETMRNGEPFHRICADCAANGRKFYLQKHVSGPYYDEFRCVGCQSTIGVNKGTPPSHPDDYEDEFLSVRR